MRPLLILFFLVLGNSNASSADFWSIGDLSFPGLTSGPSDGAIGAYLSSKVSDPLEIKDFQFEVFEGTQTGTGRISVVGTLELVEDTYIKDGGILRQELLKIGFTNGEIPYYLRSLRVRSNLVWLVPNTFRSVENAGEIFGFRANLRYEKQVDGYAFSGTLRYDGPPGASLSQISEREMSLHSRAPLVLGSEEFQQVIEKVVDLKKVLTAAIDKFESYISEMLVGMTFEATAPIEYRGPPVVGFVLTFSDNMVWAVDSATKLSFTISGNCNWLIDGYWGTKYIRPYHSGDNLPVAFSGSIDLDQGPGVRLNMQMNFRDESNLSSPSNGRSFYLENDGSFSMPRFGGSTKWQLIPR